MKLTFRCLQTTSINRCVVSCGWFCVFFVIAYLGVSRTTRAVSPPPDGGYPGGNTAEGTSALLHLNGGTNNTALGWASLGFNVTGNLNTAIGAGALLANTADGNTATGAGALLNNTVGYGNTANGVVALFSSTDGRYNTAIGESALFSNTTGYENTATGAAALGSNTAGTDNVGIGEAALYNCTTGSGNTALGVGAGTGVITASAVICIGHPGADVTGSTWISSIYGTSTVSGTTLPVMVSDQGQLGTASSSRRFKQQIKPMDRASEAILGLRPVTFRYKNDQTNTPQFGLIAEEVAEVNPDLVVRDKNGEIHTVRYDGVNAMLLNEFLKEHRAVERLKRDFQATIAEEQKEIQALTAQLKKQAAEIQKMSAQLIAASPPRERFETRKRTPQMAFNDR
jgi:Chaperone of endosialidase